MADTRVLALGSRGICPRAHDKCPALASLAIYCMKRRCSGSAFGSPACRAPSDLSAVRPYWRWSARFDLGLLITSIAADPMSGFTWWG